MDNNKSQDAWSQYSKLAPPPTQVRRYDSGGHRFYYWLAYDDNGKMVVKTAIGITSLISLVSPASPYITNWKLSNDNWEELLDDSSNYGTLIHLLLGEWLVKRRVDRDVLESARELSIKSGGGADLPDKNILSFMRWCEDYDVEPLLIEAILVSEPTNGDQYALTIDLLARASFKEIVETEVQNGVYLKGKNKGKPKMVKQKTETVVRRTGLTDFKSNFTDKESKQFYESHLMQLIGGKKAVEFNFPDVKIDFIANWSTTAWRTKPSYVFKIWEPTDNDYALFDSYMTTARLKGMFSPTGSKFMPPNYNETTKSTDFKVFSYREYVSEILLSPNPVDAVDEDYVDETSPILNLINKTK